MPYKAENMRPEHYAIKGYEKLAYEQCAEIERLNEELGDVNYTITQLHKVMDRHYVKKEDYDRLNNIINELEKYIEEMRLYYCKELAENHNCIDLFIENSNKLNHIVNIKLKLKELKGDKDD